MMAAIAGGCTVLFVVMAVAACRRWTAPVPARAIEMQTATPIQLAGSTTRHTCKAQHPAEVVEAVTFPLTSGYFDSSGKGTSVDETQYQLEQIAGIIVVEPPPSAVPYGTSVGLA